MQISEIAPVILLAGVGFVGGWGFFAADDRDTVSRTAASTAFAACHPSYRGACLPPGRDLDCDQIAVTVTVVGPDDYRLDGDGDGLGCELPRRW